jgi:hypothetical protein
MRSGVACQRGARVGASARERETRFPSLTTTNHLSILKFSWHDAVYGRPTPSRAGPRARVTPTAFCKTERVPAAGQVGPLPQWRLSVRRRLCLEWCTLYPRRLRIAPLRCAPVPEISCSQFTDIQSPPERSAKACVNISFKRTAIGRPSGSESNTDTTVK